MSGVVLAGVVLLPTNPDFEMSYVVVVVQNVNQSSSFGMNVSVEWVDGSYNVRKERLR